MVIEMANDPVANIRFTVAKTLKLLIQCVGRSSKSVTEMVISLLSLIFSYHYNNHYNNHYIKRSRH